VTENLRDRVLGIFVRARRDLLAPPIFLNKVVVGDSLRISISRRGLRVELPKDLLEREDFEEVLLSTFRHALAHAHYCPYDVVTMRELLKAAYLELNNWDMAYFTLHIFADAQVDYFYLRNVFFRTPRHVYYRFEAKPRGVKQVVYSLYKVLFPEIKSHKVSGVVEDLGRQLAIIARASLPWNKKVRLMAKVLKTAIDYNVKEVSKKKVLKFLRKEFMPLREDFSRRGFEDIMTALGEIKDEKEAEAFFRYIISRRTDTEKALQQVKEYLKKIRKGRILEEKPKIPAKPAGKQKGLEEPYLPTTLAKPLRKLSSQLIKDAIWRSYWYKAKAERALIEFIQRSRSVRPVWAVARYPDDWTIEDEVEELDLEATFEEGPLIPEVNAVKWIRQPSTFGQSIASGYSPSAVIVLDSSKSMLSVFDDAATAAHIVYLSAKRKGGKTAVVNFSTNYVVADWNADNSIKEVFLSLRQGQMTIIPLGVIGRLVDIVEEPCFIIVITDCGWQNLVEALPYLSHLASRGHRVVVFHLVKGWRYERSLSMMRKTKGLKVVPVEKPEEDLRGLVLEEVEKMYHLTKYP